MKKEEKSDVKSTGDSLINLLNDLIDYILGEINKESSSSFSERKFRYINWRKRVINEFQRTIEYSSGYRCIKKTWII